MVVGLSFALYLSIIVFGTIFSATIFYYSHDYFYLSEDQRSALLFSENGFYYSFYNDVVTSSSLNEAYQRLVYDARSEWGHTINAVRRFNIYQEITFALLFRAASALSGGQLSTWLTPMTFYLHMVFLGFGLGLAAFVRLARKLATTDTLPRTSSSSNNSHSSKQQQQKSSLLSTYLFGWLAGGLALTLYLYNWTNVTRIQVHPPLRENFGMPLFFTQLAFLVDFVSKNNSDVDTNNNGNKLSSHLLFILSTCAFLLVWQFAHILLFIEVKLFVLNYLINLFF
jgi:hypothetical protein